MRFAARTFSALLAAVLLNGAALAASFTATLDRDTIGLGETAVLTLTFQGNNQVGTPSLPNMPGLTLGRPNAHEQFSFSPGSGGTYVTKYSFPVTADKPGDFTIPAMTVEFDGQKLSSHPLKLVVTKISAPPPEALSSGKEIAFLKLSFPRDKIYAGETAIARLELYLRDDLQDSGNFNITSSSTEGFNVDKFYEQDGKRRVQIGNRAYTVIPLALPITAAKTGALTLGPFTASLIVVLPGNNNRGGDPFFRMFNQGERRQVSLATESVNIQSLPLPKENVPAGFNGAVGNFTMTASAGPTNVTAGDPITVRVQIAGRGDLAALTLPAQEAWHDFTTYPPTTKLEKSDAMGLQGTKTFEQIVSPKSAAVRELPPVTFSFFNPESGQYQTLTQPAVPLTVKPAGATPMPAMTGGNKSSSENQTQQDVLPVRQEAGVLAAGTTPLITRTPFLALQAVPVLAFLAALLWRKRADSLANNPRLRRKMAVEKLVQTGIADLKKLAADNKPDEFFALLFRLLQEQLGERLDCPASAITENVVDEHPLLRGASANLREPLHELFQLCNQARYAPVRGTSELNSVAAKFEQLIKQLKEVRA